MQYLGHCARACARGAAAARDRPVPCMRAMGAARSAARYVKVGHGVSSIGSGSIEWPPATTIVV